MLSRLLITALLTLPLANVWAHDYQIAELHIEHPWARALPPNAKAGAAYLVIDNQGSHADRLVGASSPVADKVEMHTIVHQGEVMKMQKLELVDLPAQTKIAFAPGQNHLMLFGLKQPLVAGERFAVTLEFEQAGKVEVQVAVDNQSPAEDHSNH